MTIVKLLLNDCIVKLLTFPSIIDYINFVGTFKMNTSNSSKSHKSIATVAKTEVNSKSNEVNKITITPLYKFYTENNDFDTISTMKPIRIKHKTIDTQSK